MGTTQSYLSPEALVTAAVVAGAVGFGYTQVASSGNTPTETTVGGGEGKKAKGKKKSNTVHTTPPPADDVKTPDNISVLPFPAVVPGQFDGRASDALAHSGTDALSSSSSQAKKGKKKKKAGKAGAQSQSESRQDTPVGDSVVSPAAAAALFDPDTVSVVASSTKPSTKSKKKKKQQASPQEFAKPLGSDVPSPAKVENNSQRLQQSTASIASFAMESDGEWTQVSRRADRIHTSSSSIAGGMSDVGQTTSNTTGSSSPVDTRTEEDVDQEEERPMSGPGEQNTLAKRLLPKPRKTGVEDMLATSDSPSYSRVMRVQSGDKPAAGFSWGDYEDAGGDNPGLELDADSAEPDEDEGWGVVKRGGRPKNRLASSQQSASSTSRIETAPETMTKRQRQNAARRDAEKSAKAAAEQERLATLARHKRELERAKMDAQFGKGGGKKATSGGMKAVIDEKGKLVWD
ncbi:hypothetical protein EV361DRAFT_897090 [Lentinula raphanica]|uniref:Uncharacterized protein n=1 Tax=Lentinula raphanica TaxID=153919 RepID=A0AA38UHK3_9AGAR|nr:hypothetical protein F5878DRAFT_619284 [Lentinula raphanica]KAJ3973958.1 hypothetical protein EV361DRAFT_897090 [Lentinula raphanica]